MQTDSQFPGTFDGLLSLVEHLRGPAGCPWDREQTSGSMRRYLLEECYELLEAIDEDDRNKLVDELGDVLFHLAFQVHLGVEEGTVAADQVFTAVIEKLTRRHPHVFGEAEASDARQVESSWHEIKRSEQTDTERSAVDGLPSVLPALSYAQSVQERAARAGFDWDDIQGAVRKVAEELKELQNAQSPTEMEAELGDVLFSIVNVARWLGADAEGALRGTNARFRRRFGRMEKLSRGRGVEFGGLAMAQKEALWQEAKGLEG